MIQDKKKIQRLGFYEEAVGIFIFTFDWPLGGAFSIKIMRTSRLVGVSHAPAGIIVLIFALTCKRLLENLFIF
jgi:hypothetical protein